MSNPATSTARPAAAPEPDGLAARELDNLALLVSPPHICVLVTERLANPKTAARDLGEVIAQDPALTARLLRVVNSPFYGFRARVDTVTRAVALLGQTTVHNLAIAVSAVRSFSDIPSDLVNIETFWRHGVYCGLLARACGARAFVPHPERLFVAGLLHDLGSLVLYQSRADACREHLLVAGGDEQVLCQVETEAFGFSHADLGGRLLTRWGLPESLADAVACHHAPASARVAPFEAAVLHVAEVLANRSGIGAFSEQAGDAGRVDDGVWRTLGVADPEALGETLLAEASEHFIETARLVCPPAQNGGATAPRG